MPLEIHDSGVYEEICFVTYRKKSAVLEARFKFLLRRQKEAVTHVLDLLICLIGPIARMLESKLEAFRFKL